MAFFSKFLFPVEHNYRIHNKKMLVIIQVLEKWLEEVANPIEIKTNY